LFAKEVLAAVFLPRMARKWGSGLDMPFARTAALGRR